MTHSFQSDCKEYMIVLSKVSFFFNTDQPINLIFLQDDRNY